MKKPARRAHGWHVCGAQMHYYRAGAPLCQRAIRPGGAFRLQETGAHIAHPDAGHRAPKCSDCTRAHTKLWSGARTPDVTD
jgi:hypothetical protein